MNYMNSHPCLVDGLAYIMCPTGTGSSPPPPRYSPDRGSSVDISLGRCFGLLIFHDKTCLVYYKIHSVPPKRVFLCYN